MARHGTAAPTSFNKINKSKNFQGRYAPTYLGYVFCQIWVPGNRIFTGKIRNSWNTKVASFGQQFLVRSSASFQLPASLARHNGWIHLSKVLCTTQIFAGSRGTCMNGTGVCSQRTTPRKHRMWQFRNWKKTAHQEWSRTESVPLFGQPRVTLSCPQVARATILQDILVHERALYH